MRKEPNEILEELSEEYLRKNEDYGESWQMIGELLYTMVQGEEVILNSPEDWVIVGLWTRKMDKLCRQAHGQFVTDELNFESLEDSFKDESVYASMQASFLEETRKSKQDVVDNESKIN